jgi:hypothetical protein
MIGLPGSDRLASSQERLPRYNIRVFAAPQCCEVKCPWPEMKPSSLNRWRPSSR